MNQNTRWASGLEKNESVKRLLNQLSQAIDQNSYYSVDELDRYLHNAIQLWKEDYGKK